LFDRIWTEVQLHRFPSATSGSLPLQPDLPPPAGHIAAQRAIQALAAACAAGRNTVLYWNAADREVHELDMATYLQAHAARSSFRCPVILLLSSWHERSVGVCQDVAQLAVYWEVPLLPAPLMMMPVPVSNGTLDRHPVMFHQRCRGSVVLAVSFAYPEVLEMMRDEPVVDLPAGGAAMHKYW